MSILPIFIPHAGCPHQCVFCNQKTISGQRLAAVEGAQAQIKRWLQWLRPSVNNEAAFYGGSFTGLDIALQRQLLQLTDELIREKLIGSVRLSTRPDYIDAERLQLLQQHHVELVELGVQSLDDSVLTRAERGHTAAAVFNAHRLLRAYDFKTGIQLMVGMPGQDFASVRATAQQVAELRPDIARIYPLLVIKGTPLAKSYELGEFVPLTVEQAVEQAAYVYQTLTQAGVNVIRIGLQPDEELCTPGNVISGPFHPSMGELVKGRVLREHFTPLLRQLAEQGAQQVVLHCPRRCESKLRGLKNCNIKYWQQLWPELLLRVVAGEGAGIELQRLK